MPLIKNHRIILELYEPGGKFRYRWEAVDFRNCTADFRFSALRRGLLPNDGSDPVIRLEPLLPKSGGIYGYGFRLKADFNGKRFSKIYGQNIFRYEMRRVLLDLLQANEQLKNIDLNFRLLFLKKPENKTDLGTKPKFSFSTRHPQLPIIKRKPGVFLGKIDLQEGSPEMNGDVPVYIPESLVQEMIDHTMKYKEREEAGFLAGHLCQDPHSGGLFAVCTDQIIADGGTQRMAGDESCSVVQFQFSPEIFYHAQQVVAQRKNGEALLGWWHSHPWPFICQKTDSCKCTSLFFSSADVDVMEAAFPAPYQVAVVIGGAPEAPKKAVAKMYGWRDGLVEAREFVRFSPKKKTVAPKK
jgi:proteasome lid subunit RPN8/RPN11